jgi:hypothetical protein
LKCKRYKILGGTGSPDSPYFRPIGENQSHKYSYISVAILDDNYLYEKGGICPYKIDSKRYKKYVKYILVL